MKHIHTFRNRTSQNFPSKAVGSYKVPAVPKLTVAIGVFGADPKPTPFSLLNAGPESVKECWRENNRFMPICSQVRPVHRIAALLTSTLKPMAAAVEKLGSGRLRHTTFGADFHGPNSRGWPDGWCVATPSGAGLSGSSSLATAVIITYDKACLKPLSDLQSMGVVA